MKKEKKTQVVNAIDNIPDEFINTDFDGIEEEHNTQSVEETWDDFEKKYNSFINSGGLQGDAGGDWINHSKLITLVKRKLSSTKTN